jgi:hypothetical protein
LGLLEADWVTHVCEFVYHASVLEQVTENECGHLGKGLLARVDRVINPQVAYSLRVRVRCAGKPLSKAKHRVRTENSLAHSGGQTVRDV